MECDVCGKKVRAMTGYYIGYQCPADAKAGDSYTDICFVCADCLERIKKLIELIKELGNSSEYP